MEISVSVMCVILRQEPATRENAQPLVLNYIKGHACTCTQWKPDQCPTAAGRAGIWRSDFSDDH